MNKQQLTSTTVKRGLIGGLWGTLALSLLMGAATASGVSPLPRPVPVALAGAALGAVAKPVLMLTALLLHFGIGGGSGALLAAMRDRITYRNALGLAVATLVPHLAYGGVLGWYGRRRSRAKAAA